MWFGVVCYDMVFYGLVWRGGVAACWCDMLLV